MPPQTLPSPTVETNVAELKPEAFASEIVDAVSEMYTALNRFRNITVQLNRFSDTVGQKLQDPGN